MERIATAYDTRPYPCVNFVAAKKLTSRCQHMTLTARRSMATKCKEVTKSMESLVTLHPVLAALVIFTLRIIDVSLGTLRTIRRDDHPELYREAVAIYHRLSVLLSPRQKEVAHVQ